MQLVLILENHGQNRCIDTLLQRSSDNRPNRVVRKLVTTFFNGKVKDIMTGYRAFSRLFVKTFPITSLCKNKMVRIYPDN